MDPVQVLLWVAVAVAVFIAVLVVVGGTIGIVRDIRGKSAASAAERARLYRVAAQEQVATAAALAQRAEHESQRAKFEAIRRHLQEGDPT